MGKTQQIDLNNYQSPQVTDKINEMNDLFARVAPHSQNCHNALSPQGDHTIDLLDLHRQNISLIKDFTYHIKELEGFLNNNDINQLVNQAKEILDGELYPLEEILKEKAPLHDYPMPKP